MGRKKEVGEMGGKERGEEWRKGKRGRGKWDSTTNYPQVPKGSLHLCLECLLSLPLPQTHSGSQPALPGILPRPRGDLTSGGNTPSPRDG